VQNILVFFYALGWKNAKYQRKQERLFQQIEKIGNFFDEIYHNLKINDIFLMFENISPK
jgi:hypothetical protein